MAFASIASNLVPGDTNGTDDVFVRDLRSGTTERVSVATDGSQGNSYSESPAISADGRYVAFVSGASNLVPGDTNDFEDVFVRDRQSGTTQRVNVATDGTEANDGSFSPAISADGRYVAFESYGSNLVPGDTNDLGDVFVRDLRSGTTQRVSVATDGTQANGDSDWPGDQRRRALRGLRVGRVEPRARRHEPHHGRVRARPAVGHHPAGQRGHRRHPGQQRQRWPGDKRRRALRGLRLVGVEPRPRRHERELRRVRA